MKKIISFIALSLSVAACTVGPDYTKPVREDSGWVNSENSGPIKTDWWNVFDDLILAELVEEVAADNQDIAIAEQRVREARALRRAADAAFLPSLGGQGSFRRSRQSLNNPNFIQVPGFDLIPQSQSVYEAGFDASWELDLFGGNRRASEAAKARIEGATASKRDIVLSVIAETARNYIELRGNQARAMLLQRNAALQRQTYNLVKVRLESGLSREVDTLRAEAQLEETLSLIPNIEAEVRAAAYRLAVLTGREPQALLARLSGDKPLPVPDEIVPLGLKSDLLRRRPDIQVAERNLAATTADVGVAVADLYPSFNLTGTAGSCPVD